MTIPERIREAVAAHSGSSFAIAGGPVRRGDLRRIRPSSTADERRICLVLRVDSRAEVAEVILVHTYPELATSHDLLLRADATGLSYSVVLQTDVRGLVWLTQVDRLVGTLRDEDLLQLNAVAQGEFLSAAETGVQLAGAMDYRWSFKVAEGEALAMLASDCTDAMVDGESPWQIDPGLFSVDLLMEAPDLEALAIDLMHALRTRKVELDLDDLETLDRLGLLSLDRLMFALGRDLGQMFFEALQGLVNDSLASASRSSPRQDRSTNSWRPGRPGGAVYCAPAPKLSRLITSPHLWDGSAAGIRRLVIVEGEETEQPVEIHLVGATLGR